MRSQAGIIALLATIAYPIGAEAQASEILPDIVYGHKDGMALTFDVFKPASPNGAGILYMVSGGWFSRWRAPEEAEVGYAPLLEAGFTVFSVRHGSSPRYHVAEAGKVDLRVGEHLLDKP